MRRCPVCSTKYPNDKPTCDIDSAELLAPELEPGTVVSRIYEIVCTLGIGGQGIVYLVRHLPTGRQRALKFLLSHISSDPKALKRFRQEACIEIVHPNIVRIFDFGYNDDGSPYIPMEYVEGANLRKLISLGPLSIARALALGSGIAQGLAEAHRRDILHRDMKPDNVLVEIVAGKPETPKILDFGIAAIDDPTITRTRSMMYTPDYAAPEQLLGMPPEELDKRVDIFALGVILYEMLTGHTSSRSTSSGKQKYSYLEGERTPPSQLRPDVANWPGLDDLVLSLLAKDRDLRPRSALEVADRLDAIRMNGPQLDQHDRPFISTPTVVHDSEIAPFAGGGAVTQPLDLSSLAAPPLSSALKGFGQEAEARNWSSSLPFIVIAILLVLGGAASYGFYAYNHKTAPASITGLNASTDPTNTGPQTPPISTLKVSCDNACDWTLDHHSMGDIASNSAVQTTVAPGTHVIAARSQTPGDSSQPKLEDIVLRQGESRLVAFHFKEITKPTTDPCAFNQANSSVIAGLLAKADSQRHDGDDAGAFATYQQVLQLDRCNSVAKEKMQEIRDECSGGSCPGVN